MRSYLLVISTLILGTFFVNDAFAYLDPGTGSMVFQAIIGVLIGLGIAIKIYWFKLKEKLGALRK